MVAYGGAGPLLAAAGGGDGVHGCRADFPPTPGALSAWGAAGANLQGDFVQPVYQDLGRLDAKALRSLFTALSEQTTAWLKRESADLEISHATIEYGAEMRYEGQGYDVPTGLAGGMAQQRGGGSSGRRLPRSPTPRCSAIAMWAHRFGCRSCAPT